MILNKRKWILFIPPPHGHSAQATAPQVAEKGGEKWLYISYMLSDLFSDSVRDIRILEPAGWLLRVSWLILEYTIETGCWPGGRAVWLVAWLATNRAANLITN